MMWHGFVQAGGGSTRFGRDKALARIAGRTMLQRTGELLECVCDEIRIIAPAGKYDGVRWKVIEDGWPGEGPLGGIISALQYMKSQRAGWPDDHPDSEAGWAMILGCDLPFMTQDFLAFLKKCAWVSRVQVVVPESDNGLEPLCACWRADALLAVKQAFDAGVRKVTDAMKHVEMEVLDEPAWKRFDNGNRLFWNMNTPSDYLEACRMLDTGTHE
jgi:molybdopterin-guanine dinucleotide biosynthesis protein A